MTRSGTITLHPDYEALAEILISIPHFFRTRASAVDGVYSPVGPLYLEYAYLNPATTQALATRVTDALAPMRPTVLVTPETAMLPLCSQAARALALPLVIVRREDHRPHERDEPDAFTGPLSHGERSRAVFVDDAIWTGRTLSHFAAVAERDGLELVGSYFLMDLMELPSACSRLHDAGRAALRSNALAGTTYGHVMRVACARGLITHAKLAEIEDWIASDAPDPGEL